MKELGSIEEDAFPGYLYSRREEMANGLDTRTDELTNLKKNLNEHRNNVNDLEKKIDTLKSSMVDKYNKV